LSLLGLFLGGCAESREQIISTGARYVEADPASSTSDYRLDVGDKVRVTVFNEPTLSGEFAVNPNGSVSLPLIGEVTARGKTSGEIATQAATIFGNGYLRDPKINVEVTTFRPFFILGEVKAPGQYPFTTGLNVLNAIATAQGYTPRARKSVVYIRRVGEVAEQPYEVTPSLRVYPGDTIRVGERYF
jgi:polysaccharide export outer membrane protein